MYYKNDWLLFPYFLLHEIFIQKSFKKVQNYHYLHKSNQAYSYSKLKIYISYNIIYISVLPIFFMIRFLEQNLPNLLINLIFIKNNRYTLHHNDTEYIIHFISHLKILLTCKWRGCCSASRAIIFHQYPWVFMKI